MKRRVCAWASALAFLGVEGAHAQAYIKDPVLGDETTQVSEHVWMIAGFPNIAIVVGDGATLVVDTGLGTRNGATIARVAARLAPQNTKLFLTTTHFHPEHAYGEAGFPAGTIVVRNAVQQRELVQHGQEIVDMFRGRSAQNRELLEGATTRAPDVLFDHDHAVDLGGGVTARLFWFGPAHTKGDELVFVEPDRTLISGDVVQNRTGPSIFREGGTATSWIAAVDEAAKLNALRVLPDHSPPGDGSLVAQERAFLAALRDRAVELKRQGLGAEEAGSRATSEFGTRYPDWAIDDLSSFVATVFAE